MKVLITGVDGYIGIKLANLLLINGHDVTGIDSGFYKDGWLTYGLKFNPHIIIKDTRNLEIDDFIGFDAVIHLADLSNDPLGELDARNTYSINHIASLRAASLAKSAGVKRFLYSSSCSVYGVANTEFVDENSLVNPQTSYAKCKLLVEEGLRKLNDESFHTVFLRNATVFGVSPRMRFDLVLNNLTALAYLNGKICLNSDGEPWRPIVHIDDVCNSFLHILEAPLDKISGQTYNIGDTSMNYKIIDIANSISFELGNCSITKELNTGDNRSYRVNFDKLHSTFPELPKFLDLNSGINELLNTYKLIGLTKDLFELKPYTRLKKIKYLIDSGQVDNNLFFKN